jgi:hypothetical protein
VLGTEDAARGNILPVTNNAAIHWGEAAVMPHTHGAHLVVNASVLALKTRGLARIEPACAHAIGDASLLVELALADGWIVRGRREGLGNGDGGRCN